MKRILLSVLFLSILNGCSDNPPSKNINQQSEPSSQNKSSTISEPTTKVQPVYSKEELESDPQAPSKDPKDYDQNGQYVPQNGASSNPADYNKNGEYKPVESMTQEEIQAELEQMLNDSLGQ